jgi:hypothetical protein
MPGIQYLPGMRLKWQPNPVVLHAAFKFLLTKSPDHYQSYRLVIYPVARVTRFIFHMIMLYLSITSNSSWPQEIKPRSRRVLQR